MRFHSTSQGMLSCWSRAHVFLWILVAWTCGATTKLHQPIMQAAPPGQANVTDEKQSPMASDSDHGPMTVPVDWMTWMMVDSNYEASGILECWEDWFLKSGSASPLLFICMDDSVCKQAARWKEAHSAELQQMEYKLSPNADNDDLEENDIGPERVYDFTRTFSGYAFVDGASEGTSKTLAQSSAIKGVKKGLRGSSRQQGSNGRARWPRENYIHSFYHQVQSLMTDYKKAVLHTDADAFWLKNPDALFQAVLREHPDVDIIAAHNAEPVPGNVLSAWGFVLNMGLIMFRHTEPTMAFLQKDLLVRDGNDQEELNWALFDRGCKWDTWKLENRTSKIGQCGDLKVVSLPYSLVSRDIEELHAQDERIVAHPDTGSLNLATTVKRHIEFESLGLCKSD